MRIRKDDGAVIGWNSCEADDFENGRIISGEKAMSDKDWEMYRSEIRTGHRWGVTFLVIGLGGTGAMLIQRVVEAILG